MEESQIKPIENYLAEDAPTKLVPGLEPLPKTSNHNKFFLIFLTFGLAVALLLYISTFFISPKTPLTQTNQTTPDSVEQKKDKTPSTSWVYIKQDNVFIFSQNQGRQQPLTSDGIHPKTWYMHPKFINKDKLSYVRCNRTDKNGTDRDPYTCSLTVHDLVTNQTTSIFTLESVQNSANYAIGGYITAYDWTPTADEFVALTDEADPDGLNTKLKLHHFNIATNTDTILFEHPPTPGRGGTLDDQVTVRYSPDYNTVLFVSTGLLPSVSGKPSTLMIFDTKAPKPEPIWSSEPGQWATFGTWLSPNKLAAKTGSNSGSNFSLIEIDPSNPAQKTLDTSPEDWYSLTAVGPDTIIYYSEKEAVQSGINLSLYNIVNKESSLLESNLFPIKFLGNNLLAVRTTRNCSSNPDGGCGLDIYNGIELSGFAVFDLQTKYTQSIPIPKGESEIYDFDVIAY